MIEIVLCKRDSKGNKIPDQKERFASTEGEWLSRQAERVMLGGVKKEKLKSERKKLYA